MNKSRSSGVGRGQCWYTVNRRAVRGFPSIRHAAIRAWNAASKGGTRCWNSSRVTMVTSRNSIGRDCRSANRTPAMGGASCHCIVRSEAHHIIKRDKLICERGEWEDRMLVETVLSMLTLVCHFKKVMHRGWAYFQARLAFTMAAFNVLVQWHGFQPHASGFVPLSMAEFSL